MTVTVLYFNTSSASSAEIDFETHVAPIFERACYRCHGADKQRSNFRLDRQRDALEGGDLGASILPGKPDESVLINYVADPNADLVMPPEGERLTAEEIATLRQWIAEGAVWPAGSDDVEEQETWWSLRPLVRSEPPELAEADRSWVRTPVDAFILARLRDEKLSPAPEAGRRTLIRRLYFDLVGLPPPAEEVEAFVNSADPQAYERLVDKLLASDHYGERWARHWLDVVHFGETHGYDKDKPRPNAWPYRDYVIRAFNSDKPYDRFIQEQLAGDVLFPDTVDGIEALGFISAGPWDFIGHAEVPESKKDGKIARHLDRDDMVGNTIGTFNSLTVQCAQCHNHKFDPIPQQDYYNLQAVFAAVDRADKPYFDDPVLTGQYLELTATQRRLVQRKAALDAEINQLAGQELAQLDQRLQELNRPTAALPAEYGFHSGLSPAQDTIKWVQVDLGQRRQIRRVTLSGCHDDFNNIGAGFGFPVRFAVEAADDEGFTQNVQTLADRTADDFANPGTAPQSFDVENVAGRYVRVTASKLAPRQNDYILALAELEVFDDEGTNQARGQQVTSLDSIEAAPRWRRTNLTDGLYPPRGDENRTEQIALLQAKRAALLEEKVPPEKRDEAAQTARQLAETAAALAKLPPPKMVYAGTIHNGSGAFSGTGAQGGKPRTIHLLRRGEVDRPADEECTPGALSAIAELPSAFELSAGQTEGDRRAALARWVSDERNPLTWRSIVNRVWQYHFGRGLVDTPNDFGRMGERPSHPELLEWLAVDFRDGGRSLKQLHRLLVTSSVYRQSAVGLAEAEELDSGNVLLSHFHRRRLEAEAVRDAVLAVAGKLDRRMGGPSFRDFVVEHPEHSPHYEYGLHDPNDPATWRRSVYRFLVRSQPQPFMTALDCADPSMRVDKRNESLSALQALAMLNEGFMVAMSQHFAAKLAAEGGALPDQADRAFRDALARPPTPEERAQLVAFTQQHGLENLCRLIFNLNEFAFVD